MIRIKRKENHKPNMLYVRGDDIGRDKLEVKKEQLIILFHGDPANYSSGKLKLPFDSNIYGDEKIRNKLVKLQHGKCCYCEKKLDTSDVEHFRPKSSYRRDKTSKSSYPGYFWLAYSWDNLLLACRGCNLKKSDLFPISYEANRANHPNKDFKKEAPLLINPMINRPRRYLRFEGATIVEKNKRLLGTKTIEVLELNRSPLEEIRRDHLRMIEALVFIAKQQPNAFTKSRDIEEAKSSLELYRRRDARFSAMTNDRLW